jgi:hypothetical protein
MTPAVLNISDDVNNIKYNLGYCHFYGYYWLLLFVLLSLLLVTKFIRFEVELVSLSPPKFAYPPRCYYGMCEIKYEFGMVFNSTKFILNLTKIHLAVIKLKYAEGRTDIPHVLILRTSCIEGIIKTC